MASSTVLRVVYNCVLDPSPSSGAAHVVCPELLAGGDLILKNYKSIQNSLIQKLVAVSLEKRKECPSAKYTLLMIILMMTSFYVPDVRSLFSM